MSTAVSSHSGAGPLSLMSCVRESSPPQDGVPEYEVEKNASSKKKFWNPRKWFKRKSNKVSEEVISSGDASEPKETLRSRSTSELSVSEEQTRRRSGTPMHPGLSVSHDSVFHSPHSGSELDLEAAQSSSSLSISHQPTQQDIRLQTELNERLRLRRTRGDTSEDDEGLPRSPCNSPTTTDGLLDKSTIKDHPTKSHSTCSDGSLLSMGSSEMDEDSFGLQSRHSSKLSLHDKRSLDQQTNESEIEWGPSHSSAPLNHSAAHHKVSIRPKRTHGAPRRKRAPVSVTPLPTTPEVNEDTSMRSATPESTRETITELYTSMSHRQKHTITDPKIKCSSLPPGLAGPGADGNKLSRSRSNAGHKSQDPFSALEEEDPVESSKKFGDGGFFGRIFPRRSAKKKKDKEKDKKEEKSVVSVSNSENYSININYEPFDKSMIAVDNNLAIRPNALRSGPASRQRMQPIDIPASPDLEQPSSPLQAELESHFKNKSPPKSPWQYSKKYTKEESRSKIKIAGLSSLQQRVLSLNDETDNSFKSLTNLPTDYEKPAKTITKSHSFKSATKISYEQKQSEEVAQPKDIFKSISLDSVKNLEEKIVESVNEAKVTISGPSHKAVVNIGGVEEEHLITKQSEVTKIQVKRETTHVTIGKSAYSAQNPTNIILTANNYEESEETRRVRKFSNDNIEVIKKISEINVNDSTEIKSNNFQSSAEVSGKRDLPSRFDSNNPEARSKRLHSDSGEVSIRFDDNHEFRNRRINSDTTDIGKRFNSETTEFSKRYNDNTEVGKNRSSDEAIKRFNNENVEAGKRYTNENSVEVKNGAETSRRYIKNDCFESSKKFVSENKSTEIVIGKFNHETSEVSRREINDNGKQFSAEIGKRNYAESTEINRSEAGEASKRFSNDSNEASKRFSNDSNEYSKRFSNDNSGEVSKRNYPDEASRKYLTGESEKKNTHTHDSTEVVRRYIKNDSSDSSKKNSDSEARKRFNSDGGDGEKRDSGKRFSHDIKTTTYGEVNRTFNQDSVEVSKRTNKDSNEVNRVTMNVEFNKRTKNDSGEINRRFINHESAEVSKRSLIDSAEVSKKSCELNCDVGKKVITDSGEVKRRYVKNDSSEVSRKFYTESGEVGKRINTDSSEVSKKIYVETSEVARKIIHSDSGEVNKKHNADNNEFNKKYSADSSEVNRRHNSDSSEVGKRNNADGIEASRKLKHNDSYENKKHNNESTEINRKSNTDSNEINKKFKMDSSEISRKCNIDSSEVSKKLTHSDSSEVSRRFNPECTEVSKKISITSSEASKRFSIDSAEVGKRLRPEGAEVSKKFTVDSSEVGKKRNADQKLNTDHAELGKRMSSDEANKININSEVSKRINSDSSDISGRINDDNSEFGSRKSSEENDCGKRGDEIKTSSLVTVTPMNNRFYKKHDSMKKPAVASEKPMLKIKSNSFEAVEVKKVEDKSSQNSLDRIDSSESIVLRRKSLIRQKTDEEPELMKVFARRSLKLKDSDSEALSQQVILMVQESERRELHENQSDKENFSDSSPLEERKKTFKSAENNKFLKSNIQKAGKETAQKPLTENQTAKEKPPAKTDFVQTKEFVETSEVTLRKPSPNNKFSVYQRTVSLQSPKNTESKLLKTISVVERPKTDTWFNKNQDDDDEGAEDEVEKEEVQGGEIITEIQELNVKPKNFNQRMAEWEKRAQEALKKTVP